MLRGNWRERRVPEDTLAAVRLGSEFLYPKKDGFPPSLIAKISIRAKN
jgi:hypothetical protein